MTDRPLEVRLLVDTETASYLTSNNHRHWRHRQRAAKQVRGDAKKVLSGTTRRMQRALVTVELQRRTRRLCDPDNVAGIAKPVIDGAVDAGLLPDDNWKHVVEVRNSITPGVADVPEGCHRLVVVFEEVDPL